MIADIDDLRAVVARIEMRNSVIPTRLYVTAGHEFGRRTAIVGIEIEVPHRDTGDRVTVARRKDIMLPTDESHVIMIIHNLVSCMWLHEMDECWHVNGQRVRDPHRNEEA